MSMQRHLRVPVPFDKLRVRLLSTQNNRRLSLSKPEGIPNADALSQKFNKPFVLPAYLPAKATLMPVMKPVSVTM